MAAGSSQTSGGPESKASALGPASTMARSSVGRLITVAQTKRLGSKALKGSPSRRSWPASGPKSVTGRTRRLLHSRSARLCSPRSPPAKARCSRQRCFGLGNQSAQYLAHRQDFIDASGGLARPEHTLVLTARLGRRDDLTPQAIALATRFLALAAPLIQESGRERARDRVETRSAWQRADVVQNINLYRVLGLGCRNRLLPLLRGGSLRRGNEPRAEIDPDRAEHQRRRNAASVEDAAGRDDGNGRHGVYDLGHECHRADLAAIAPRLAALRDDHVDAALSGLHCLRNRRDVQHHE